MTQSSDILLVARCQAGDDAALEELYDRHAPGLMRYLERMVGDASLAEDFCQDAFLRIWRKVEMFDAKRGTFSAWLYRAATNLALNRLALRSSTETTFDFSEDVRGSTKAAPAEAAARMEREEFLRNALLQLSPRDRAILTLRHLEERSVAEVAVILTIPEGTVKSRVHYALRRLKALLDEPIAGEMVP